ncbi:MAG TPA: RNB domain-containing ribonuclease [Propionibacteriaceae bacterium]|nr:RNB domain-containing ribonuclease [Propionibacteriaceae bacterium]
MPARFLTINRGVPPELVDGFLALQENLSIEIDFPDEVVNAAQASASDPISDASRVDHTGVEFVTIDPPNSRDLDQAVFIERTDGGYRVWYAIADVAAWVEPGGPIDQECQRRGQTMYAPRAKAPLHPPVLSEDAASLLADGVRRPALVWQVELDDEGRQTAATVERGWVISREKLSYEGVQAQLDSDTASGSLQLLRTVGLLREQLEIERGGVSLAIPEQEIEAHGSEWTLTFRRSLPVEGWNAQISLLTGMAAATMMLDAGVGILRTLPPAEQWGIDKLRRQAKALKIRWPGSVSYPEFVRSLDAAEPDHQAMLNFATSLFRGAGYTVIDSGKKDANHLHGALAANYTHTTAPLRRLVDRYVGEVCVHLSAGEPVPTWVLDALPALPQLMAESDARAKKFERGVVNLVEALVLRHRVGEVFEGVVVDVHPKRGATVSIPDPAIEAPLTGDDATLGEVVRARLDRVDLTAGSVSFSLVT